MTRSFAHRSVVLLCLAIGLSASLGWLYDKGPTAQFFSELSFLVSLLGLSLVCATTACNLGLRWFRWHFLTRRWGVRLRTRDSVRVYLATLPLILTPFYCGEALRGLFFQRRNVRAKGIGLAVWVFERVMDGAALLVWWLIGSHQAHWALVTLALCLALVTLVLARTEQTAHAERPPGGSLAMAAVLMLVTLAAWSLPIFGLWGLLSIMGLPTPFDTTSVAFGASTMAGAFSGLPVGVGVSGSLAIVLLEDTFTSADRSELLSWAVAVFRLGTVWLAVGGGALLAWIWRKRLAFVYRGQLANDHFDEIAADYGGELPTHVKDRMLTRKVAMMRGSLQGSPASLRGLDLGCGQGWYITQMAKEGFDMVGIDASPAQVELAQRHAVSQAQKLQVQVASATKIPFPDNSFDFVYSINVVHHILDDKAREQTFREVCRVLKPGGVFFLHEMNTVNPMFRFYMSYLFPLLHRIDEGNERWIMPHRLPKIPGASWSDKVKYFTFLPDFAPPFAMDALIPLERRLERTHWTRRLSAHFMAKLEVGKASPARV